MYSYVFELQLIYRTWFNYQRFSTNLNRSLPVRYGGPKLRSRRYSCNEFMGSARLICPRIYWPVVRSTILYDCIVYTLFNLNTQTHQLQQVPFSIVLLFCSFCTISRCLRVLGYVSPTGITMRKLSFLSTRTTQPCKDGCIRRCIRIKCFKPCPKALCLLQNKLWSTSVLC